MFPAKPSPSSSHGSHVADLEQARQALYAIPSDLCRDDWVKVGMAAHAAGLSFDDFDAWSSLADNYQAAAARDTWRSFKTGKGIGSGTLFQTAQRHGWQANRTQHIPPRSSKPAQTSKPNTSAADIWQRCQPATPQHPYIDAKNAHGVPMEHLRTLPAHDGFTIAGERMGGSLVVPITNAHGDLLSLQFITSDQTARRLQAKGKPTKLNLPGSSLGEGWFTVGTIHPGTVIYVCEGIGQAWACWRATGHPAVVCFGWGRAKSIATVLRDLYPASRLVLIPDVGKEDAAAEIASTLPNTTWVGMPTGWPTNADVCDLAETEGMDMLVDLLEQAQAPQTAAHKHPFNMVPFHDLSTHEPQAPHHIWQDLLPAGHVTLLGAHGGTGKSLLALMLAVHVALGRPLFGLPTTQSNVAFFSGEDAGQLLRHRLHLICKSLHIDVQELDGRLHIIDATDDPVLFTETNIAGRREGIPTAQFAALQHFVREQDIKLLIVDNASDTFDASEIDRARVRGFMRTLSALARDNDAGLLLLAHVDKGTSRGDRLQNAEAYSGSTAWHNSARSRLFMMRNAEGNLVIEHQKNNLGKRHDPIN